jgi:ABC-type multidrug transport system fused ATPase/permease subunit
MAGLVTDLARPYRGWLVVILAAMLVETVAGLANPWPLKIVIDNVVGYHTVPVLAVRLLGPALAADGRTLAAMAAGSLVLIAGLGGLASYIDNYYTESVGQWVAYTPDATVLQDVTFSVATGQFVGVVGATGSGKSTIVSLIPRFYDPTAGRILIDGSDIREYTLRGLRRHIGFVLQETVLFRGTVRENIAYGRHRAAEAQIVAAAQLANADEFIVKMPGGYGAPIGERGITLSGGQRQRIGIARAFIRNAPILILDEPTASLESESEQLVMQGLDQLMKGRTVLMITHRLSTIRRADTIIVLHEGIVAEQGTHDDLLARGGIYAGLYWAKPATSASSPVSRPIHPPTMDLTWRAR